jgi:hypothetical protein
MVLSDLLRGRGIKVPERKPSLEEATQEIFGRELSLEEFDSLFAAPSGYSPAIGDATTKSGRPPQGSVVVVSGCLSENQTQDRVAIFIRSFYVDPLSNKRTASHDLLRVEENYKGRRIGRGFVGNGLRAYVSLGIKAVVLCAAEDGRYQWAICGWQWDQSTMRDVTRKFIEWVEKKKGIAAAKVVAWVAMEYKKLGPYPWVLASLRYDEQTWGKDFFQSDDMPHWNGVLTLQDGEPSFERAKQQFNL